MFNFITATILAGIGKEIYTAKIVLYLFLRFIHYSLHKTNYLKTCVDRLEQKTSHLIDSYSDATIGADRLLY